MVYAIDHGGINTLARSGDQNLLGAAFQVSQAFFLRAESTRAFKHHVNTQFLPGKVAGIAVAEHTHTVAIDDEILFRIGNFFNFHFMVEVTVHGVMT